MSLPTTVTNRAQGNNYVGATGMEFAVQTGFVFVLTTSPTADQILC